MTQKMLRHLVIEHRVLEVLEERDRDFDDLCVELRKSPAVVRRAVSALMRKGWIHLMPGYRRAVYRAVTGALVGWVREQET